MFLIPASLVQMQSGPIANNRAAFIEYDLAIINADHGPELVLRNFWPPRLTFFVNRDPVADRQCDLLSLEHIQFPFLVEWQCFSMPSFLTMIAPLNWPKGS